MLNDNQEAKIDEFFALVEMCNLDPVANSSAGNRLFSDGELTSQKAGVLLWHRNEWQLDPPAVKNFRPERWPESLESKGKVFGFVWSTYEDAKYLRELFLGLLEELSH